LYGKKINNWIGKRITLFSMPVLFRGEQVPAVRVKAEIPGSAMTQPKPPVVEQQSTEDLGEIPF
jgi:hypothetical protein